LISNNEIVEQLPEHEFDEEEEKAEGASESYGNSILIRPISMKPKNNSKSSMSGIVFFKFQD